MREREREKEKISPSLKLSRMSNLFVQFDKEMKQDLGGREKQSNRQTDRQTYIQICNRLIDRTTKIERQKEKNVIHSRVKMKTK